MMNKLKLFYNTRLFGYVFSLISVVFVNAYFIGAYVQSNNIITVGFLLFVIICSLLAYLYSCLIFRLLFFLLPYKRVRKREIEYYINANCKPIENKLFSFVIIYPFMNKMKYLVVLKYKKKRMFMFDFKRQKFYEI